ncbi:MAG: cobalt-precorrin-6A reductase [Alphaproteobacteria bacterium]|nr:cobalt-precorrin-6A reductase [Alphaproteobacteria bacterium]
MAAPAPERLLILGGTAEGRALAEAAEARFGPSLTVISALAGRTRAPILPAGDVRIGGFGGTAGLAAYLKEERIGLLIDATHPYATQISAQACEAASQTGTERLALVRPPWKPVPGDRWIDVATVEEAVGAIPAEAARVFLTVGIRSLAPFAGCPDLWFLVRLVDEPAEPMPLARHQLICARGPFEEGDERALLADHRIDCLVTRASGGEATAAKLAAARALALPVVMVRRPPPPPGPSASSVEEALTWIEARLAEK